MEREEALPRATWQKVEREWALPRATWEGVEATKGGGKRWNVNRHCPERLRRGWRQQKGVAKGGTFTGTAPSDLAKGGT